jgi:hypothetical protein
MPDIDPQWGDLGTWVVGVVAAIIAYQQYRRDKFRPTAKAFRDDDRRIVVRIINEGAGSGLVQDINLLPQGHPEEGTKTYYWEIDEQEDKKRRLVPFALSGRATAQLVLKPLPSMSFDGIRVRIDYGDGKDSGCIDITKVDGHIYGTTHIPDWSG